MGNVAITRLLSITKLCSNTDWDESYRVKRTNKLSHQKRETECRLCLLLVIIKRASGRWQSGITHGAICLERAVKLVATYCLYTHWGGEMTSKTRTKQTADRTLQTWICAVVSVASCDTVTALCSAILYQNVQGEFDSIFFAHNVYNNFQVANPRVTFLDFSHLKYRFHVFTCWATDYKNDRLSLSQTRHI